MKKMLALTLLLFVMPSFADDRSADSIADKRAKIDTVAEESLGRLFEEASQARELFDQAYGYAVFTNLKLALGVSGGGGSGVAVERGDGERTYMRMGTAGVGLGAGGRRYRIIFVFEDEKTFRRFVDKGWQADTAASATAGTAGVAVASSFTEGLAVFQLAKRGLMAHVEIAGTKYWKSEKLN